MDFLCSKISCKKQTVIKRVCCLPQFSFDLNSSLISGMDWHEEGHPPVKTIQAIISPSGTQLKSKLCIT